MKFNDLKIDHENSYNGIIFPTLTLVGARKLKSKLIYQYNNPNLNMITNLVSKRIKMISGFNTALWSSINEYWWERWQKHDEV